MMRQKQRGFLLNPFRFGAGGSSEDPHFSNVSLLLHCNGSNGSTTFPDSSLSPKTVTANGSAQVSTARSKFGGASGLLDGSSFLGIPAHPSLYPTLSSDYTIECWIYMPSSALGTYRTIAGVTSTSSGYNTFLLDVEPNGALRFAVYDSFAEKVSSTPPGSVPLDAWAHVTGVKYGTSLFAFLDGVKGANTGIISGPIPGPNGRLAIGRIGEYAGGQYFFGNVDEIRITQGVARYIDSFTPPAAAFPDS